MNDYLKTNPRSLKKGKVRDLILQKRVLNLIETIVMNKMAIALKK